MQLGVNIRTFLGSNFQTEENKFWYFHYNVTWKNLRVRLILEERHFWWNRELTDSGWQPNPGSENRNSSSGSGPALSPMTSLTLTSTTKASTCGLSKRRASTSRTTTTSTRSSTSAARSNTSVTQSTWRRSFRRVAPTSRPSWTWWQFR